MDRRKCALALSVCLVAVVAAMGTAHAISLPFDDGFEAVAVGEYPSETGWQTLFYGMSALVTNETAFDGQNSFRLDCWSWLDRAEFVALEEVPDRLTFEAAVRVYPNETLSGRVGFVESNESEGLIWNFFRIDAGAQQVEFHGDGVWVLGPYDPGTWCTVRAAFDYQSCTADVWLDGLLVASGVPITPKEFSDPDIGEVVLDKLGLVAGTDNGYMSFFQSNIVYFDEVKLRTGDDVIAVEIDVKPGEDPNPINCRSRGVVPVAVLSSDSFDALDVDPSTVLLSGAAVCNRGPRLMVHEEDVDEDGLVDLVLHFGARTISVEDLEQGSVVLTGSTFDGQEFEASDEVTLVGPSPLCPTSR